MHPKTVNFKLREVGLSLLPITPLFSKFLQQHAQYRLRTLPGFRWIVHGPSQIDHSFPDTEENKNRLHSSRIVIGHRCRNRNRYR